MESFMNKTNDIAFLLPASKATCSRAVCALLRQNNELSVMLFQQAQPEYFSLLQHVSKDFPKPLIQQAAIYKVAYELYTSLRGRDTKKALSYDEEAVDSVALIAISLKTMRPSPKDEWLHDHANFVLDLNKRGVSYRNIQTVINNRFRKNISYEKIRHFVITQQGVEK
jgi:hypothetical protein